MLDYAKLAVSRLASQFKDSPKIQALMAAIVEPLTALENDADSLKSKRWIDTAEGRQLDGCGHIVGEPRLGIDDESYRAAIRFRVFVNTSNGTPSDLIRGLKFLTNPTDCQYLESYPATAILFTNGFFVPENIQSTIQDISPAGISDVPVAVSFTGEPFRFSRENRRGRLYVNNGASYLTANGSPISVTAGNSALVGASAFGGVVASRLKVTGGYLKVNGYTIKVYNPDTVKTLGHDYLTGVYQ